MGLKLHNTLTRTKEEFVPIDATNVRMYVCGPTVYDFAHIGNARPLIVFDVLFRLLRHLYGPDHVTYVRNITDVDDKIIARAAEEFPKEPLNEAITRVTQRTTKQFHEDVAALGCLPPTVEPRATEYIDRPDAPEDMIRLIAELIDRGNAYAAEGHVLFDVTTMPDYGKLSNRSLDDMIAGARVEVAPYKKNPMDFVLWKPSKAGEPSWPSPWSTGRPGWHIECSAMAGALLGAEFDIHGGGLDLIFPHHENEIAQSRCAHGTPVMANYWLHNGFLQVEGEKMSKSLGNFVTINELLHTDKFGNREWMGDVLRLAMLMTHYRAPLDFTVERLQEAQEKLGLWESLLSDLTMWDFRGLSPSPELVDVLADDLNTPEVMAFVSRRERASQTSQETMRQFGTDLCFLGLAPNIVQKLYDETDVDRMRRQQELRSVMEVSRRELGESLRTAAALSRGIIPAQVDASIAARAEARKAKNFAEADRIRAELDAMGVALKDSKDPATGELVTTWEVKR
jgi:cysteinyl-tRNA synthetase